MPHNSWSTLHPLAVFTCQDNLSVLALRGAPGTSATQHVVPQLFLEKFVVLKQKLLHCYSLHNYTIRMYQIQMYIY